MRRYVIILYIYEAIGDHIIYIYETIDGDHVHWVNTHFPLGHCKIQTLHDSIFSDPNPVLFLRRVFEPN